MRSPVKRILRLSAAALVLSAVALPASAVGQATRTWVSGVGDDVNPCSRTAPCRTFAGAISKTAIGGEIDTLDPGGYGTLNITKSITIDGGGGFASIAASGVNGVIVNLTTSPSADPLQKVTLRNLSINGSGSCGSGCGGNAGLNGIRVDAAKVVRVENSRIFNFAQSGIDFTPANSPTRLIVDDTIIRDNTGRGIVIGAGSIGLNATANRLTIRNSRIVQNGGSAIESVGASPLTPPPTGPVNGLLRVAVSAFGNLIADNGDAGLFSNGPESRIRIGQNDISGNILGLRALNGGQIISFGNNHIGSNNVDGVPTSLTPTG